LDLHDNRIGSYGAKAVANALRNPNRKLTTLNFKQNKIGGEGAKAVAEALKMNPSLVELSWDQDFKLGQLLGKSLPALVASRPDKEILEFLRKSSGKIVQPNVPCVRDVEKQ